MSFPWQSELAEISPVRRVRCTLILPNTEPGWSRDGAGMANKFWGIIPLRVASMSWTQEREIFALQDPCLAFSQGIFSCASSS